MSGSTAPTSVATRVSSRCRCGHSSQIMSPPTSASLTIPLTKLTSACFENRRLAPATGEIFDSRGLSGSADHSRRCWMTLPARAASASTIAAGAIAVITPAPSSPTRRRRPPRSNAKSCAPARTARMLAIRLAAVEPEKATRASAAPAITNQVVTSWLLTTSPCLSASSRRLWVGSSVLLLSSRSSAMARCLEVRQGTEASA